MASDSKTVTIVPLTGKNYATWKIQCQMALVKDGLWTIVNESEDPPAEEASDEKKAKYAARKDQLLCYRLIRHCST